MAEVGDEIASALEDIATDAALEALVSVGLDDNEQIVDVVNERAVAAAQEQAAELVTNIDETTRDMLRDQIAQGLEENIGLDEIAAGIADSFGFSEERADLIARTEITDANSQGALTSYREAQAQGIAVKKEWLLGPNPCEICQENADEGPIDLDDDFPSGDDAPSAHPNCECALSPVVEEGVEGEAADAESVEQIAKVGKVSKDEAEYVDSDQSGKPCAECTMFRPSAKRFLGSCTAVKGDDINPGGHCRFFERRE